MIKKNDSGISDLEGIKNLLILLLLQQGVNPKVIELATGTPEKTIRNKFPMKFVKGENNG